MNDQRMMISVRVEEALHRELRFLAADRNQSLGELCVSALQEWKSQQQPVQVLLVEQPAPKEAPKKNTTTTKTTSAKKKKT